MTVKYSIMNCVAREGLYRACLHVDGVKYSKDYSQREYNAINRLVIESELREGVLKIIDERLQIVKAKGSL